MPGTLSPRDSAGRRGRRRIERPLASPGALLAVLAAVFVAPPAARAQAETGGLARLSFMAGCWAEEGDGLREQFSVPTGNMMLGTSRFLARGEVVQFEFHRIEWSDDRPVLTPYPDGVASVSFAAAPSDERLVTFENPDHDFPQRIRYDGRQDDVLIVAIEGERDGRVSGREWRMGRVSCTEPGS